jgi:hypothetical protein
MHEPIETHPYKGHTIALYSDDDAPNPRDHDNLGHMVCWHLGHQLGDTHSFDSPEDFEHCVRLVEESDNTITLAGQGTTWFFEDLGDTPLPKTEVERFMDQLDPDGAGKVVVLPLYLYDHSGITMQTTPFSCPWDSGQVGYIYVERAEVLKEYGGTRLTPALIERAKAALRAEVESYDRYLSGAYVGFVITDRAGETLESCWGFDDPAYALTQAKAAINAFVAQRRRTTRKMALQAA